MKGKVQIIKHVLITPEVVCVDGREVIKHPQKNEFDSLIREIYKGLGISYSKFYKMDRLSKLAFVSAELISTADILQETDGEKIAMLFFNRSSTNDTDLGFLETVENIPSPAVFVYTLPNIAMGELAIRNGWKGENLFLIETDFSAEKMNAQLDMLFSSTAMEHCVCGWIEYSGSYDFRASVWLVSGRTSKLSRPLNTRELATDFSMY